MEVTIVSSCVESEKKKKSSSFEFRFIPARSFWSLEAVEQALLSVVPNNLSRELSSLINPK